MLEVRNSISIKADPKEVWDWLVNTMKTKLYMFGCEAVSTWEIGSQLDWQMVHAGESLIPVTGFVKEIEPFHRLVYTVIDPFAAYENIPENQLNVIYEIQETEGGSIFSVTQNGFETVADGESRYKDVSNGGDGWNPILNKIKEQIEA